MNNYFVMSLLFLFSLNLDIEVVHIKKSDVSKNSVIENVFGFGKMGNFRLKIPLIEENRTEGRSLSIYVYLKLKMKMMHNFYSIR